MVVELQPVSEALTPSFVVIFLSPTMRTEKKKPPVSGSGPFLIEEGTFIAG